LASCLGGLADSRKSQGTRKDARFESKTTPKLEREQTAQTAQFKEAVSASLAELQKDPSSPVAGTAGGVTVVEFFDYHCGYCKKAEGTIVNLLADHPEIHFVFKEFPILGPQSSMAAKAGLAAHKQGGYLKFHQALMTLTGPITMDAIAELPGKQGLDVSKLKTDMDSPEVQSTLARNHELGHRVGVKSTPNFVIGSEVVSGAIDAVTFERLIAQAKPSSASQAQLIKENKEREETIAVGRAHN
jgi:protein-disulfide isomerase